jgi:myo-inositol-1(or 4)-monophosphatase
MTTTTTANPESAPGDALDLADVLRFTKEMVTEAAARADTLIRRGPDVSLKADGTLVTNVDQTLERFFRETITARYPGHAILGEEFGADTAVADPAVPLWALDPIDGTTNLAHGLPIWGISVGLIVGDAPVVGVVAAPQMNETFAAARGLGATLNDVSLPVLAPGGPTEWEDAYAICSTSARTLDFSRFPARLRIFGSAALDICYVAAGHLSGCHCLAVSLYDVAAALVLSGEVGAEAGWLSGEAFSPRAHARAGSRADAALAVAPPRTLAFVREHVRPATA